MKIYHTETQEDYDALMIELEVEGCTWGNREIPTKGIRWETRGDATCVHVSDAKIMTVVKKSFFAYHSPEMPITKYKAKADEKMRFTKENVYKLFTQYRKCADYSLNDLQDEILKLDDTPEKVAVPKFVAEWIESYLNEGGTPIDVLGSLMSFHASFVDESVIRWFKKNSETMLKALTNGYTIEKEQLYYIPLPHLETADGTKQYLTKSGAGNYFALSPCIGQKQRYTKEELAQVPEIYKFYATLIEEEEE